MITLMHTLRLCKSRYQPGDACLNWWCILYGFLVVFKQQLMQSFLTPPLSILQSTHCQLQQLCVSLEQSTSITGGLCRLHLVPR